MTEKQAYTMSIQTTQWLLLFSAKMSCKISLKDSALSARALRIFNEVEWDSAHCTGSSAHRLHVERWSGNQPTFFRRRDLNKQTNEQKSGFNTFNKITRRSLVVLYFILIQSERDPSDFRFVRYRPADQEPKVRRIK